MNTDLSQNKYSPYVYVCACVCIYIYMYECKWIAHVTQGHTWGLFFLLLSILLQFSSETSHLIFWIMESVAATAILQIGQRHTFYVNWELKLNFPQVWDVSIYGVFKRLYYSKIRASCKDWIHIQNHILKCIHFVIERSFKTCQAENNTLFVCCLTIQLQIDPIVFWWFKCDCWQSRKGWGTRTGRHTVRKKKAFLIIQYIPDMLLHTNPIFSL